MKNKLKFFCSLRLIVLQILLAGSLFAQDTTEQINLLTKNDPSQYKKPYVILISADGFRADFTEKYDAKFFIEYFVTDLIKGKVNNCCAKGDGFELTSSGKSTLLPGYNSLLATNFIVSGLGVISV